MSQASNIIAAITPSLCGISHPVYDRAESSSIVINILSHEIAAYAAFGRVTNHSMPGC